MIMTHVIGGLGNQMFQYAAGRALAAKHGRQLYLDIDDFADYGLHYGFELARIFSGPFNIASCEDRKKMFGWRSGRFFQKVLRRSRSIGLKDPRLVFEPHFHYWEGFEELSDNSCLVGYWQSEMYFKEYASEIRKEFIFKLPMSDKNMRVCSQIDQTNAVSIHVRRGDYANNPQNMTRHGLCSLEYYARAINYIAERVENPYFIIFSDEIEWVQNSLTMNFPHQFVNHNHGTESYNDMRLMSLCKHHIIANSSFSWWGAWLAGSPEQIVVAPTPWFETTDLNACDLIKKEWHLIERKEG